MTLTQFLNSVTPTDDGLHAEIPESWMQGRSTYGGLQAVLAARAMQTMTDELPLRTLQASLIEPIAGHIEVQARLLRSSKNTRQIEAKLMQGETVCAIFVGIFGRARESIVQWNRPRTVTPSIEQRWPYLEGLSPQFLQNLDVVSLHGHPVASGHADTEHLFRLNLKDEAATTDLSHILCLADFPPPIGLSWSKTFKPGSTMTWMLNFTGEDIKGHTLSNWECEVVLDAAQHGYTHQTVSLYAPDGRMILRGTQCMVVFT